MNLLKGLADRLPLHGVPYFYYFLFALCVLHGLTQITTKLVTHAMEREEAAATQPDLHLRPSPNHCNSPRLTSTDTTSGAATATTAGAAATPTPSVSKVCKVDEGYSDDTRSSSDQDLTSSPNDVMALSDWMLAQSEHDRAGMCGLALSCAFLYPQV